MFGDQSVGGGFDLYVGDDLSTSGLTTTTAGRVSDIEVARGEDQSSRRVTRSSLRTSLLSVEGKELSEGTMSGALQDKEGALKPMQGFQEEIPAFDEQVIEA